MKAELERIIGRRKLTRIFGVTQGFVEGLEREGAIHPLNIKVGKLPFKVFSAKDVNIVKYRAINSTYKSCRKRGLQIESRLKLARTLWITGARLDKKKMPGFDRQPVQARDK